jgi:hypothetical protein
MITLDQLEKTEQKRKKGHCEKSRIRSCERL